MRFSILYLSLFALFFGLLSYSHAQIRVACVGNSITFGSGIENREQYSYPAQLQTMLGKGWEVRNFGVSGRTMLKKGNQPLWEEEAFANALAFKPNVVVIKLGTNDSKDFNWKYKEDFVSDFQAMVDTFQSVSDPLIFVCIPVPVFGDRWNIDSTVMVEEVNPRIMQVAASNDLMTIDLYHPFLGKPELFPDLIHPSGHGAALMAGIIASHLLANDHAILMQTVRP